jgi:sodium pump decarboxylase gamma subunit
MMIYNKILALAGLSAHPSFGEMFRFQIIGIFIVLAALSLIALILGLMGRLFREPGVARTVSDAGATPDASAAAVHEDPHELVAVITAAVYSMIEERHRIVSIHPMVDGKAMENLYLQSWSVEGRRQHFASHKMR